MEDFAKVYILFQKGAPQSRGNAVRGLLLFVPPRMYVREQIYTILGASYFIRSHSSVTTATIASATTSTSALFKPARLILPSLVR